ncbi:hypothetical protein Glove_183g66 [Diversispora epigaea]|uniref:MACPF domain-containing protein n=1 Tax=Diversispora epigaea TaxID=1348612 RepID=A0A397IR64_9GLOM|nr:hypothetical protein Glove_183g66 [Diversispora epigaea]
MLGTAATTDLEKLLLEQKDAIDNILKSQPVYAVGPNFQQGYYIPCITCYVSEPLEAQVLAKLSVLFDHKFEIVEQVVESVEEDTGGNNNQNRNASDPCRSKNSSNRITNDGDGDGDGNGIGNYGNSNGNSNGNGDEYGDSGDENGNGDDGNSNSNSNADGDEFMEVSSEARVIYKDYENEFQSFNINAKLWANVSLDYKFLPPVNTLEFKVNLFSCEVGKMLNERCQKLHNFIGYFLDSVEIGVSPLSCTPGDTSNMISSLKKSYMPQRNFTSVDHSIDREKNFGLGFNFGNLQNLGSTAVYNARNNKNIKSTTDDWFIERSGCFTTGVQWLYRFTAQELYKDGENQRNLPSTDLHSGHWYIKDNMKGFSIAIKQVLNYKIKFNKFSFGSFVIKCPKVIHTLEITFNDLEKFNEGFAELRKKLHYGTLNPQIKLGKSIIYSDTFKNKEENNDLVTDFERKLEGSEYLKKK